MTTKQEDPTSNPEHRETMTNRCNSAKSVGRNLQLLATKFVIVAITAIILIGGLAAQAMPVMHVSANVLKPGAIIYTDSGDAVVGGAVIMVDPMSHERTTLVSGLDLPLYLAMDSNGHLIVSAAGRLVEIDFEEGQIRILANMAPQLAGYACGVAADRHGNMVCADLTGVVSLDPLTLTPHNIPGCSDLPNAIGVAVADNGDLIVVMRTPAQVVRVNPHNGKISLISAGRYLNAPQAIAVRGHDIYVSDVATPDGNFGIGTVIHIDDRDGSQELAAWGDKLIQPMGIAIDNNGFLIVADPYTVNLDSLDKADGGYDGAILRINPLTHNQDVLVRGEAPFVNARGVMIVPDLASDKTAQIRH
jgi:hypothetical protein